MFGPSIFLPERDIPSLQDKVIIVTGANTGIGKETVRYLAAHNPAKIYLAARSEAKAKQAISEIEASIPGSTIYFMEVNLSSLASVAAAASKFNSENTRLDLLINNAGIMAHPPSLSVDGYETQFATNHMGHFLLTRQLLPLLKSTSAGGLDVRIINVSSAGHAFVPKSGWSPELATSDMAEYTTLKRYGQSKLANILFTTELASRHPDITSVAIHPGGVATNLAGDFRKNHSYLGAMLEWLLTNFGKTPAQGAWNQVWASVTPLEKNESNGKGVRQGEYYEPVANGGNQSALAKDKELAKKLWEWSEMQVKEKGY